MNLRLLQIADSALPISGYTHSWGLEAAIARGLVHDPESLERWTAPWLQTSLGPLEGVLVASGCRAAAPATPAELLALNRLAEVSIMPPSTRRASREMGEQLLAPGVDLGLVRGGAAAVHDRHWPTRPTAGTTRSPSGCSGPSPAASPRTC